MIGDSLDRFAALLAGGTPLDEEFAEGYRDGRDPTSPDPSENRSAAYRHSFEVGRAEIENRPIPADVSRRRAAEAESEEARR